MLRIFCNTSDYVNSNFALTLFLTATFKCITLITSNISKYRICRQRKGVLLMFDFLSKIFVAAKAAQEAHLSLRSYACTFVCIKDVFSKNICTIAPLHLGNLATWNLGNLATFLRGNLAACNLDTGTSCRCC